MARHDKEDFIYKTTREKFNAVIEDVTELSAGRPLKLTSVEISELSHA
jgi:preprotein translocase subunit SecA